MKSSRGILIVLVIVAVCLFAATPAFASVSLNKYEKQLVSLINKQRVKHGLHKVRANVKLVDAAQGHSTQMAEADYFSHDSVDPRGETWSSRIVRYGYQRTGYAYWKAGEDIYWGAGLYSDPVACVDAWMHSPAHRAVILTRKFRDLGVGAYKADDGYQGSDGVVWVFTLDMGRRTH